MRRTLTLLTTLFSVLISLSASPSDVRGINLLSRDWAKDSTAVVAAASRGLNHLQLSHKIAMNLCDLRDPENLGLVSRLSTLAHDAGITEVCLWDHALYDTDHYPAEFKYPGTGLLDLDNPELWDWIRNDYREMMTLCPEIDGLVLTFIESGARVENQYSVMSVPERLAKVIATVSEVVCDEYGKTLWLRSFAYNDKEYAEIAECFGMLEWKDGMGLMMKDVPHDFFLPHPDNPLIGRFPHPTLVEFDACGEYSGQSVILNTMPELFHGRMSRLSSIPEVVGYVARTSRCGDNEITDTPAEINMIMLDCAAMDPAGSANAAVEAYLRERYGIRAARRLRKAFAASRDIIEGTMYIMNLSTTHHSELRFDAPSTYSRHVSGRWTGRDSVFLGHGINKEFHWWNGLVNTLAPLSCKNLDEKRAAEIRRVLDAGWISKTDDMNLEYLRYIRTWTDDCMKQALKGFRQLKRCRRSLAAEDYRMIFDSYERSLMCLELRKDAALCWWGGRLLSESAGQKTAERIVRKAAKRLEKVIDTYRAYDKPYPKGTWDFLSDADIATEILNNLPN